MITRIVVPLDGSELAEGALETARAIATMRGASMDLVAVLPPRPSAIPPGGGAPPIDRRLDEEMRRALTEYIGRMAAAERSRSTIPVKSVTLEGEVAPEIAAHVERVGADLVVMTTHGRGGLERLWLGSVAEGVIRRVHVPVLLVRRSPERDAGAGFREVLVALAGDAEDRRIVDAAFAVSDRQRARYTLLRVVLIAPFFPTAALGGPPAPLDGFTGIAASVADAERDTTREYLERLAAEFRAQGANVNTVVEVGPNAARGILATAERLRADLIVMGTHARGRLGRLLLGSVADKVVRSAETSVLVVPPES